MTENKIVKIPIKTLKYTLIKQTISMQISLENNYSVVVQDYAKAPEWKPNKLPILKQDQILIQVEASTINPSDVLALVGQYRSEDGLPLLGGKQGVGRVVRTGDKVKQYDGKRVCFCDLRGGGWSHYAIAYAAYSFIIDQDVPVSSAASGIVNPLTVIGFIHEVKRRKQTSIVHTAAASALGRMLNKICKSQGITLLNVVRRQQHADLLRSEGAQHIIVTEGDWQPKYAETIKKLNSKVLFDALGGGQVQTKLIELHPTDGVVLVYGLLEGKDPQKPTTISFSSLIQGLEVTGFILNKWLQTVRPEEMQAIQDNYSKYLRTDLASSFSKQFKFSEINEALEYYKENATKGKILLKP